MEIRQRKRAAKALEADNREFDSRLYTENSLFDLFGRYHVRSVEDWPLLKGWSRVDDATISFWALHTGEAGLRMLKMLRCLAPLHLFFTLLHVTFNGVESWRILHVSPYLIVSAVICLYKQRLEELVKQSPIAVGSGLQACWHLVATHSEMAGAFSFDMTSDRGELMRHRMFLGMYAASLVVTATFYVPRPLFLGFVCPLHFGAWLFFHSAVNFLQTTCILWGVVLVSLCAYLYHLQSSCLWREFEATSALETERCALAEKTQALENEGRLRQAARESLHGILSSISDASCVCAQDGKLLDCSPHLREILDCPQLVTHSKGACDHFNSLNLCSFAATNSERERLANFLAKTSSDAHHRAATIQCSFRNAMTDAASALVEARLYAIVMPDVADEPHALFMALQTQSTVPIKEASGASVDFSMISGSPLMSEESPTELSGRSEDMGDDEADVILGGSDENHTWQWIGDSWQCFPFKSRDSTAVRLRDVSALPLDSAGKRTSFGSLSHLVASQHCHACAFHRKGKCNKGALCFYCHADHVSLPRVPRRPLTQRGSQG